MCPMHWLLVAPHCYKKNQRQNLNHSVWPLLECCHFRKKNSNTISFKWKITFSASSRFWAQVLKKMFKGLLLNRDIQWVKLIKTPHIHTKFYILEKLSGFRKWQNSISGSDKAEIFIYKVPFTIHLLLELILNITNTKE